MSALSQSAPASRPRRMRATRTRKRLDAQSSSRAISVTSALVKRKRSASFL